MFSGFEDSKDGRSYKVKHRYERLGDLLDSLLDLFRNRHTDHLLRNEDFDQNQMERIGSDKLTITLYSQSSYPLKL
jgi:hypothetical protein